MWGGLWHSFRSTQACWKLRWFLKQLDKFIVAVKWALSCRSVEVERIILDNYYCRNVMGFVFFSEYLLLATVWLGEGGFWSDMPCLVLGFSDHSIVLLWLCGSLGWARWAAESVAGLFFAHSAFSAASEPDESSVQFSFLHHVGFIDNKTKYYNQFYECQN